MFPPPDPAGGAAAAPNDDDDTMMDEDAMLQAAIAASMEVREIRVEVEEEHRLLKSDRRRERKKLRVVQHLALFFPCYLRNSEAIETGDLYLRRRSAKKN